MHYKPEMLERPCIRPSNSGPCPKFRKKKYLPIKKEASFLLDNAYFQQRISFFFLFDNDFIAE